MDRKLLNYLPPYLQEYKEHKIITSIEQLEIEAAWKAANCILEEVFVLISTRYGIKRMEQILKIQALDTETLETRRYRILLKLREILPYTYRTVKKHITEMCEGRECQFEIDIEDFIVNIICVMSQKQKLRELLDYLYRVLPANLIVNFAGRSVDIFRQDISYQNIIQIRSDFFPRYNIPHLYFEGTWKWNGIYTLDGYEKDKAIEFYPSKLQISGDVKQGTKAESRLHTKNEAKETLKTQSNMGIQSETTATIQTSSKMSVSAESKQVIQHKETLTIEKDLWFLDGTYSLDGTKLLDAEIINHEL